MAFEVLSGPAGDPAAEAARRERALRIEADRARDTDAQRAATADLAARFGIHGLLHDREPRLTRPDGDPRPMCAAWADHHGGGA